MPPLVGRALLVAATVLIASSESSTSPVKPPVNGAQPVVSPRGDLIAFLSNRSGTEDLYVVPASGGKQTPLTQTPEQEVGPDWTPDGKEVVFSISGEQTSRMVAVDRKGKRRREIGTYPGRAPRLSPDGKHVLSMAGGWTATRLTVTALDGGSSREITDGSSIAWNAHWSPDGTQIAFTGRDEPQGELAVYVMNADGSGRRRVSSVPASEGGAQWPVWSADGKRLAVQVNSRAQKGSAHIWIVDVATGKGTKLAAHDLAYLDETPSWFPDGKRIAFQSNRTGTMEVWTMRDDGTDARQVTGR